MLGLESEEIANFIESGEIEATYEGIFLWLKSKRYGPYCVPCSTENKFNQLTEQENGEWLCTDRNCGRSHRP